MGNKDVKDVKNLIVEGLTRYRNLMKFYGLILLITGTETIIRFGAYNRSYTIDAFLYSSKLLISVTGLITAIMMFEFLFQNRKYEFELSFAIKKRSIFYSKYLSGLILIVPITLIYIYTVLIISRFNESIIWTTQGVGIHIMSLSIVLEQVVIYTVGVLAAVMSKSKRLSFILTGVFIVMPVFVFYAATRILSVWGENILFKGFNFLLMRSLSWDIVFIYNNEIISRNTWILSSLVLIIPALIYISLRLFEMRAPDRNDEYIPFKVLRGMVITLTILGVLIVYSRVMYPYDYLEGTFIEKLNYLKNHGLNGRNTSENIKWLIFLSYLFVSSITYLVIKIFTGGVIKKELKRNI